MDINYLIRLIIVLVIALIVGYALYKQIYKSILNTRAADGVCIRADDGEVYLRMSEAAQKKLADPATEILILRVVDASTRNKHPL